jgi:epoxyqueuosine reductase
MVDNERIRAMVREEGADYCGVADLSVAKDAVLEQGGPQIASYPRAISIGIRIFDEIVDLLPSRERWVSISYRQSTYDVINSRLDQLASRVASELQREGHRAMPIPASKRFDSERLCAAFSHKMAAHLAGLGWIGKSCLLVTPDHGPRVRWVTVLTDAPLEPTGEGMEPKCGSCHKCVDACPVHAFTGRQFDPQEPRSARYDAHMCEAYFDELEARGDEATCGLCVAVCPRGKGHR